jgi:hypothetical protein
MADRKLEGLVRLIDKRKAGDRATAETMIELGEVSDPSGSAGAVPTCTVDGDDADVFEPYGLAGQAASGDALVFAPGGDSDNLTALVSSVAGRPATEPGDKALWTAAGHVIYLDDDGDLTVTGKGGGTVVINGTTGAITVNAGTGADVTINVGVGQSVNVGGPGALALTKWAALETAIGALLDAGALAVGVAGDPAGENAGAAFAAAQGAWALAIGINSPEATKAKGE